MAIADDFEVDVNSIKYVGVGTSGTSYTLNDMYTLVAHTGCILRWELIGTTLSAVWEDE